MRIDNPDTRSFYEIECTNQQWSVRQLSRQVGSSLYERLALSRDKNEVMRLATEGQTIEKPSDIIKDPLTLEFLGLKSETSYTESKLENAIINKMQQFLLELGQAPTSENPILLPQRLGLLALFTLSVEPSPIYFILSANHHESGSY